VEDEKVIDKVIFDVGEKVGDKVRFDESNLVLVKDIV